MDVTNRLHSKTLYNGLLLFLCSICFAWLFYINQHILEGIPHINDELGYIIGAKIIAMGKLYLRSPILETLEPFLFLERRGQYYLYEKQKLFTQYPLGHPMVLSVGILLGNIGVIPPAIGAITLYCLGILTAHITNRWISILAVVLLLCSPFFQMQSSSFMSHTTASLLTVCTLLFLILSKKQPRMYIITGIFWGLLFHTRPLNAIALSVPIVLYYRKIISNRDHLILFGICFIFVLLYVLIEYMIVGNIFKNRFFIVTNSLDAFPILEHRKITSELGNFITAFRYFISIANGWPLLLSLWVPLFAFLNSAFRKSSLFILLIMICHVSLYFFYYELDSPVFGPRILYELLPMHTILLSIGIYTLFTWAKKITYARHAVPLLCAFLLFWSVSGWITGYPSLHSQTRIPASVLQLQRYFGSHALLQKSAGKLGIHHAIIFVEDAETCTYQWRCFGIVMAENDLSFTGDIIWLVDRGQQNAHIRTLFPDRSFYRARYDTNVISKLDGI